VALLLSALYLVLLLYFVLLLVRLVFSWVQQFAREWKPGGIVLVIAEVTFTVTDPPIRALQRVIPPLRIGTVAIDLSFILIFIVCTLLMSFLWPYVL